MTSITINYLRKPAEPPPSDWPPVHPETREQDGLRIDRDVRIPMRDGVGLRADIYRPAGVDSPLPTLVVYSPYGKHNPLEWLGVSGGLEPGQTSGYTSFEGPDPLAWCPKGFAIVNIDTRGSFASEGDRSFLTQEYARDGYDAIEWLAVQPWSNGRVGMIGVSFLAMAQYHVAQLKPPHLCAIMPWEGSADLFRDTIYMGGIPDRRFFSFFSDLVKYGGGQTEDVIANQYEHELFDDYWKEKTPDLTQINVPAYIAGGWGEHGLHLRGSIAAFEQISNPDKWIEIHGSKEWVHFYDAESVARQQAFFTRFLTEDGADRTPEVEQWPRMRIRVRHEGEHGIWRGENEWPFARTRFTPFFFDADNGQLVESPSSTETRVEYNSTAEDGLIVLDKTFAEPTEITGPAKLRLWLEAKDADDADIFVVLQKVNAAGEIVKFPFFAFTDDGNVALGWLRASHRELDPVRSSDHRPFHTHRSEQRLSPGEIVPLDIEIWPSCTHFEAGETLRLVVLGRDFQLYPDEMPVARHETRNAGRHVIHTGGRYDTHLLLPIVPQTRPEGE